VNGGGRGGCHDEGGTVMMMLGAGARTGRGLRCNHPGTHHQKSVCTLVFTTTLD
jgi:hypothetical protein